MPATDVDALFARASAGDRGATGRLLTLVERAGPEAARISELAQQQRPRAHVIGVTGAPGAGKSTLVASLARIVETPAQCAVLAVDPSSPVSGGAILGDRVRMDPAVGTFIRSFATRGHLGGLSLAVPLAIRLLDALGFATIVVETVGVGQVELEVAAAADTTIVVVTPGWGDAIQASKAGLLEVADVYVVNKADRPGAADAQRDLESMVALARPADDPEGRRRAPVLLTTAQDGSGVPELWAAVREHREFLGATGLLEERRVARVRTEIRNELLQLLAASADEALGSADGTALVAAAFRGELGVIDAAAGVRELLASSTPERIRRSGASA
ncbi:MAG TPA: methylmalonyl Co-A mutase-associated GTPase MeaB [Acidimicrobiia bacterium]|nr:methylmalonyl Co-A mutase-associated GTPase MeaB [Acidimicrobiia bacterium]